LLIPNRNEDDAYHKTAHNGGFNISYMLELRNNMIHYVQLIDAYAPCVVSRLAWNNEANMADYCGANANMFERKVLSISDEAFLLVVLINYSARWHSEYANDIKKVRNMLHYSVFNANLNATISILFLWFRKVGR
jgi:hypothetical protein